MKKIVVSVLLAIVFLLCAVATVKGEEPPVHFGVQVYLWPSMGVDPNDQANWVWGPMPNKVGETVYPSKALLSINGSIYQFTPLCPNYTQDGYRVAWSTMDGVVVEGRIYADTGAPMLVRATLGLGDILTERGMECGYRSPDDAPVQTPVATATQIAHTPTPTPEYLPPAITLTPTPDRDIDEPVSKINPTPTPGDIVGPAPSPYYFKIYIPVVEKP